MRRIGAFQIGSCLLTLGAALLLHAAAQAAQGWYNLKADDGSSLLNQRVPIELTLEIDRLKGVLWVGAANPDVTLVEFMDYNCPFCRTASGDIEALVRDVPGLQVKFVQNAIISPQSQEAARTVLAAFRTEGAKRALSLHEQLFSRRGRNNGAVAHDLAVRLGSDSGRLDTAAKSDEVAEALKSQMKLAADLGLVATPSFVINGVSISGYPGPQSLRRIVDSVLACDAVTC